MKLEGGVFLARSVGELDQHVISLSSEGWRIISVIDKSNQFQDSFLIISQREVK